MSYTTGSRSFGFIEMFPNLTDGMFSYFPACSMKVTDVDDRITWAVILTPKLFFGYHKAAIKHCKFDHGDVEVWGKLTPPDRFQDRSPNPKP